MERESRTLEYKEQISKTFLKTVSAYANFSGGKIIFGINDRKEIIGFENLEQKCLDIENTINDNLSPVPDFNLIINNNKTITLTINEGLYKPYLYKNKAFKRNDSSTVEVDRLEYNRLILEGMNQTFEQQISLQQNLTFSILESTLIKHLKIEKLSTDILKTLELITPNGYFNNAAALFADNNQFKGIDIVRFGNTISEIKDRKTLENVSILEQFYKAIETYSQYYQYEKIEGINRNKIDLIPEKAFREALANALIHRLWDIEANIKISMYDDRIEISSPDSLLPDISVDEYLNGQISSFRNPIIGNIFFRLHYIEKFGTGIMRINEAYRNNITKPKYHVFENSILVILPVLNTKLDNADEENTIINLLTRNILLSRSQIDTLSGFNKAKTVRILNRLLDQQIIEKTGKGKDTKYQLKK